jgi:alpha-tubulin suppressor-like RCC1 family protein
VLIDKKQKVWACGLRKYSGLGKLKGGMMEGMDDQFTAILGEVEKEEFKQISVGEFHTMAVTTKGHVYGWGSIN